MIDVLIVDDSPVSCQLLKFVAESDPSIKVIGTCSNGLEAIDFIKSQTPHVILMDIHMPKMDGFQATRVIMSTKPIPIIICSADYSKSDTLKSFRALEAGALAILEKPPGVENKQAIKSFLDTIKTVSEVKLITRKISDVAQIAKSPLADLPQKPIDAIAIGASLGGPQALQEIFTALPHHLNVPIFITQHIAKDFAEGLATWLKTTTGFNFIVPNEGDAIAPGKIYITPGYSTMELTKAGRIKIIRDIPKEQISSSISTMLKSIAEVYGSRALGIILTGMGRDGVDGLLAMKRKGALTIAQSPDDCLMFGMPKEAIHSGASQLNLNLKEIATYLEKLQITSR